MEEVQKTSRRSQRASNEAKEKIEGLPKLIWSKLRRVSKAYVFKVMGKE